MVFAMTNPRAMIELGHRGDAPVWCKQGNSSVRSTFGVVLRFADDFAGVIIFSSDIGRTVRPSDESTGKNNRSHRENN